MGGSTPLCLRNRRFWARIWLVAKEVSMASRLHITWPKDSQGFVVQQARKER